MELLSAWFNLQNFLYLLALVGGYAVTLVTLKWRPVATELHEVLVAIRDANEDGVVTDDERKVIMKEALDVAFAILKNIFNPFKVR